MDMRINKYLSEAGVCSRREADRLIENGAVKINNKLPQIGQKVATGDVVTVNGKVVKIQEKIILLALNKPVGIECTTDKNNKDNIVDFVKYPERVYPIGRLDKNSEGLILLTNRGEISDKMMRGSNYHEKEYVVTVDKKINSEFISKMSSGVHIVDEEHNLNLITRKCKVSKISDNTFSIVLTQGVNRQIRRMCSACGYNVTKLKRIRIMNIHLDGIQKGKYREVSKEEYNKLMESLNKDKKFKN